jgi:GcrA cell cycle regulator
MAWTDERIALLKLYWEEGRSASQIAELLGESLSRNAVIGKAHRLGLAARPSPLRTGKDTEPKARPPRVSGPASGAMPDAAASTGGGPAAAIETRAPAPTASAPTPPAPTAPAPTSPGPVPPAPAQAAPSQPVATAAQPGAPRAAVSAAAAPAVSRPSRPPASPRDPQKTGDKVSLLELNDRICKWPVGHPDEPDFHFCGKPVNPGFPYCSEHCLVAYQAQMPRRDRPNPPPRPFGSGLPRPR